MRADPAARLLDGEPGGKRLGTTATTCEADQPATAYIQRYRLPPADLTEPHYPRYAVTLAGLGWTFAGTGTVYERPVTDFCRTILGTPVTLRIARQTEAILVGITEPQEIILSLSAGCRPWPVASTDTPAYDVGGAHDWHTSTGPHAPAWTRSLGGPVFTPPVGVSGTLVAATSTQDIDNSVYGLDPATGRIRWRARVPGLVESLGGGSGVAVVRVAVIGGDLIEAGDLLEGLDTGTGALRWVAPNVSVQSQGFVIPAHLVTGAGNVYVANGAGTVGAYDIATGAVRWKVNLGPGDPELISDGTRVYAAPPVGITTVEALSPATGRVLWRSRVHVSSRGRPGMGADGTWLVVCSEYDASGLSATDGHQLWQRSHVNCGGHLILIADGIVAIAGGIQGLDAATGRTRWWFYTGPGRPSGAPVVAGRTAYTTNDMDAELFAFDLVTGEARWQVHTATGDTTDPVVAGGMLCVGSGNGGVAGFRLP